MQLNVTPLTRHKAYTGHPLPVLRRTQGSSLRPPKVSAREPCVRLVPGLGVTCNARRQALQRSRQDQMEFFLHLFYNSLNTA